MSSICLLSVEKLQPKNKSNQRSENVQKQMKKQPNETKQFSRSAKSRTFSSSLRAVDNILSHDL